MRNIAAVRKILWQTARFASVLSICWLPAAVAADDSDWDSRSTAPGVLLATNFDVKADVSDWIHDRSGNIFTDSVTNVSWYESRKMSGGGSMRIDIYASDDASSGQWVRWINKGWDDGTFKQGFKTGDEFYVQVSMYHPASYVNQQLQTRRNGLTQTKILIVSNYWQSNRLYELVTHELPDRIITGYNRDSNHAYSGWDEPVMDGRCGMTPDFIYQPAIDLGPQDIGTSCENMRAQYGGLNSYRSRQNAIDGLPDPLSPAVVVEADQWQTLLLNVKVGTFNRPSRLGGKRVRDTHIRLWVANAGENYILLKDGFVDLGSEGGGTGAEANAYNAIWLMTYGTQRMPFKGVPTRADTYVLYDELIVSTRMIPVPTAIPGRMNGIKAGWPEAQRTF